VLSLQVSGAPRAARGKRRSPRETSARRRATADTASGKPAVGGLAGPLYVEPRHESHSHTTHLLLARDAVCLDSSTSTSQQQQPAAAALLQRAELWERRHAAGLNPGLMAEEAAMIHQAKMENIYLPSGPPRRPPPHPQQASKAEMPAQTVCSVRFAYVCPGPVLVK
jgi:hypothetical protein